MTAHVKRLSEPEQREQLLDELAAARQHLVEMRAEANEVIAAWGDT